MYRSLAVFSFMALVAACTPPELDYCRRTGTAPAQLDQCTQHYFAETAAFESDLRFCSAQADQTYPQSLYSGWGTALVRSSYGYGGRLGNIEQIETPPDYQKNAQLDALRMNIIEPCMQDRGWNSGTTWEAGRRQKMSQMNPNGGTMPWLHK